MIFSEMLEALQRELRTRDRELSELKLNVSLRQQSLNQVEEDLEKLQELIENWKTRNGQT